MKISGLRWVVGLLAIFLVSFAGLTAYAESLTPVNTQISNQAVAQYKDTEGIPRVTNSNIVYVIVKQIAGLTVSPADPATVDVLANQTVHHSFSVTNTGNGPDSFTVTLAKITGGGQIEPESLTLYRDVNGNGVIDAGDTEISGPVGPIAAGSTAHLIARFRVPSTAAANEEIQIQLSATSGVAPVESDPAVSKDSAVITFNVVTEGVLSSTLQARSNYSPDTTSVEPGGEIKYTITALNQGMLPIASEAAKVTITIPDGLTLKENSLKINEVERFDPEEPENFTIELPTIHGGQAAVVEYVVDVPPNYLVGNITNQVKVQVGESGTPTTTNQVQTRVLHVPEVDLTQAGAHVINPTAIGQTYSFNYTVKNNSNGPDRIFIHVEDEEEWSIAVYTADGLTELPKQSGQYTVGNLPAGASTVFIVKVTVPAHVTTDSDGSNIVTVKVTSEAGASDQASSVLENFLGAGVTASAEDSEESGKPGTIVEYIVKIKNEGPATDLFDLTTEGVPNGYVVEFFDEDGNPISDISIGGGDTETITVRVTIPTDAAPTDDPESFKVIVTSQNNSNEKGHVDLEIGVETVIAIEIAPNRTGAANRGSFTTQTVTLRNLGNDEVKVDLSTSVSGTKRLEYVFLDADDKNTVIGETQTVTLAAGASADIVVRIDVPSHVAVGTTETARVEATVDGTTVTNSATITTEVLGGQLQLQIEPDISEVLPGGHVVYTITATNISVGKLTEVEIREKVPEHTTFVDATVEGDVDMTVSYSKDNGVNWDADPYNDTITDVKWELNGALAADAEVIVTITVKVK